MALHSIYLDYNATTPVADEVLEYMLPYFSRKFGNAASSLHSFGWEAKEAVEIAREQTAALIGTTAEQIVFTSGATESINLAIKGVFEAYRSKGKHIVSLATEHKAVVDTLDYLQTKGAEITVINTGRDGIPDPGELKEAIRPDTILVCAMLANNETGLILPVKDIAEIAHSKGSLFFTDATQACGKIKVSVDEAGADLLALSAHKFYGPKGTGALFIRRKNPRVSILPQLHGGGHENGRRSGTLNVPGIAGMGKAAEVASALSDQSRIKSLRDIFEAELKKLLSVKITCESVDRLPNTSHIIFKGIKTDRLISALPKLAFSTGSACSSALSEPSHVLLAMGFSEEEAYSSARFSFGSATTEKEILIASNDIINAVTKLRQQFS